jgi:hypothetical protein
MVGKTYKYIRIYKLFLNYIEEVYNDQIYYNNGFS